MSARTVYSVAGITDPTAAIRAATDRATAAAERIMSIRVADGVPPLPAAALPDVDMVRGTGRIAGPSHGHEYRFCGRRDERSSWSVGSISGYVESGTSPADMVELTRAAEDLAARVEELASARESAARSADAEYVAASSAPLASLRAMLGNAAMLAELAELRERVAALESVDDVE